MKVPFSALSTSSLSLLLPTSPFTLPSFPHLFSASRVLRFLSLSSFYLPVCMRGVYVCIIRIARFCVIRLFVVWGSCHSLLHRQNDYCQRVHNTHTHTHNRSTQWIAFALDVQPTVARWSLKHRNVYFLGTCYTISADISDKIAQRETRIFEDVERKPNRLSTGQESERNRKIEKKKKQKKKQTIQNK